MSVIFLSLEHCFNDDISLCPGFRPYGGRTHPPPLTTDSSTQSADPLLLENGQLSFEGNPGFKGDSFEGGDNDSTDGGFKPGNQPGWRIGQD